MSDFNIDFRYPITWLLVPLLPLAFLSGCTANRNTDENDDTDTEYNPLTDVQAIAAGERQTCALLGSGGMRCWGSNDYGQLGDGTTVDKTTSVDVMGLSPDVQAIAAGAYHTCALIDSGDVQCWGFNRYGQLGNGISGIDEYETTPVDVVGLSSDVQAVAAGVYHTCALIDSGGIKCWGHNEFGQLGDGTEEGSLTPVDVVGLSSDVQAVAAGVRHTCAVLAGGVKCWGWNDRGQLGDGTTEGKTTPVDVVGLSYDVQTIAASVGSYDGHTCALLTSGSVKCWGWNSSGQLGNGISGIDEYETTPVDVSGLSSGVQAIAVGGLHTCALLNSGGLMCWGWNRHGQLGNGIFGDDEYETTPVDVVGLSSDVQAVAAGADHTCALLTSGDVKCWGWSATTTPVDVS